MNIDRTKGTIIGTALVAVLLLTLGIKKAKSIEGQITQQRQTLGKLDDRLKHVKDLEYSLELRRMEGRVLRQIPRVKDPVTNQVLIRKFFESLLSGVELEAQQIKVQNERASKDFPAIMGVSEVPLLIGIKDYSTYVQIIEVFEEFKTFPFQIEMFALGATDIPVPGQMRIMLKYYIIPEAT
jgi:hypothetical protein